MTIGSGTAADVEERVAAIKTALCKLDLEEYHVIWGLVGRRPSQNRA